MLVNGIIEIGQIVRSKAGRDLGNYYVVIGQENDKLLLVDGYTRRIESPKKKNIKHIQKTNYKITEIALKIRAGDKPTNKEICRALSNLSCIGDDKTDNF